MVSVTEFLPVKKKAWQIFLDDEESQRPCKHDMSITSLSTRYM